MIEPTHQLTLTRHPHTQQWECTCGWRGTPHAYATRMHVWALEAIQHMTHTHHPTTGEQ
jgi:hypothetical protein